ncbi:MAG: phosphoglycerate kinase [Candidatus Magasanikbacteria bacterium]|nr:phosphoglycerate kinase [Candidatus Magasanikbacteria bacterium]
MKSIKSLKKLKGKRVLLRVDFNVPLLKNRVLDHSRLQASLPTVQYLMEKGAKIILLTHIGRPGGKIVPSFSTAPVAEHFGIMLGKGVKYINTGNWSWSEKRADKVRFEINHLEDSQIAMLENTRFSSGEEKNDKSLAELFASLADIFVLDGFAVAHRPAASVLGITRFLPSYAGLLLEKEIRGLEKVMKRPKRPFVLVLGGAKLETKIPVIKHLLPQVTNILLGGALVNTYLYARGYGVGASLVQKDLARKAMLYGKNKKVIKPLDLVVGNPRGSSFRVVDIEKKPHLICKKNEAIFDMGPKTVRLFASYIKQAKTLVWNGAMGVFEQKPYDVATLAVARLVASRSKGKAYGVIGGGETLQSMDMAGMTEYIDLVSTGGGAMLEFLSGEKLPGIEALR